MSDTQRLKDALKGNGALLRDPRVDKAVSWILTTLVGLAVLWGGSSLSGVRDDLERNKEDMRTDLKKVGEAVQKLEVRFAKQSTITRTVEDHERRLRKLEAK